jgi:hypothetical protein
LAAREDVPAKGFDGDDADVENGFEEVEKGFASVDPEGAPPKRVAPIFGWGVGVAASFGGGAVCFGVCFDFAILFPRIALTLPSFLLHALRRQLKMYNRRSWFGKRLGSAPLSCKRSVRSPLQTLHFAREPEGVVLSSSHVYLMSAMIQHFLTKALLDAHQAD